MIQQKICDNCGELVLFDDKKNSAIPLFTGCFPQFIWPLETEDSDSFFRAKIKNNSRSLYDLGFSSYFITDMLGISAKSVCNWAQLGFDKFCNLRFTKDLDTLVLNPGESLIIREIQVRNSRLFINDLDSYYKNFLIMSSLWHRKKINWKIR